MVEMQMPGVDIGSVVGGLGGMFKNPLLWMGVCLILFFFGLYLFLTLMYLKRNTPAFEWKKAAKKKLPLQQYYSDAGFLAYENNPIEAGLIVSERFGCHVAGKPYFDEKLRIRVIPVAVQYETIDPVLTHAQATAVKNLLKDKETAKKIEVIIKEMDVAKLKKEYSVVYDALKTSVDFSAISDLDFANASSPYAQNAKVNKLAAIMASNTGKPPFDFKWVIIGAVVIVVALVIGGGLVALILSKSLPTPPTEFIPYPQQIVLNSTQVLN